MSPTAASAEASQDSADPPQVSGALKGLSCVLCRLACALVPAGGFFGIAGGSHRGESSHPEVLAEIGVGGSAGLSLVRHPLDGSGRILVRVGDGRPVSIGKHENLMRKRMEYAHCDKDPICRKWRSNIELGDLPEDVLCRVFAKLPINEVVRTSVLSSKWNQMWTTSSKLSLNCTTICKQPRYFCDKQKYTQEFIDGVNTVLRLLQGKVVEDLKVKFEFDNMLVDPLNDWISFAVSSHTKNLALDLVPAEFRGYKDRYVFPFELFNSASRSRIRHIQLSCVSFKPHSQFMGFPNLKKLDLHLFDTERKGLDEMLSGCSNLEWLSLIRCRMKDELKVKKELPRLLYLCIAHCSITKVDLCAENLRTFVFHGMQLSIELGQIKQLETADLHLYGTTLEYVFTVLPNVFRSVQNLTLNTYLPLEMPSFLENIRSFSQLKILQLFLFIGSDGTDNILSLASFMRASPLIEKLEIHFDIPCLIHVESGSLRSLPRCSYDYMRSVHITGFTGIRGQLEFLLHVVENTPALMVLTIDPIKKIGHCGCKDSDHFASRASISSELEGKISPGTKVHIL
ncbi:hypothetical protein EJB05_45854 [Eragrostis curvula]|uniref:F-box domain-containing protein n=1 Tax=Eragrostis curvula TaxID=38414 RepID=A0A5J9TNK9_9POAL|nr:hypothetical protein EJB05_45854 [Eragrostis curvula]